MSCRVLSDLSNVLGMYIVGIKVPRCPAIISFKSKVSLLSWAVWTLDALSIVISNVAILLYLRGYSDRDD